MFNFECLGEREGDQKQETRWIFIIYKNVLLFLGVDLPGAAPGGVPGGEKDGEEGGRGGG